MLLSPICSLLAIPTLARMVLPARTGDAAAAAPDTGAARPAES
jgi:hypothetical protein